MKPMITFLLFTTLMLIASSSFATRSVSSGSSPSTQPKNSNPNPNDKNNNNNNNNNNQGGGIPGGVFGPGGGFNIPGFGNGFGNGFGGGYGSGYGGPNGGHSKNGIIRPSVTCTEKGPCYQKKLTCPAKCFTSFSHSGKGYGGGGGGGGCTIDCKKKCSAYC
ncbi:hypothetical protein RYX36_000939 [Vicia faba]